MFIQEFRTIQFIDNSTQVKLPRPNLILDPRASIPNHIRFHYHYHDDGMTVTITRVDGGYRNGVNYYLHLRVYDPARDSVPDFDSTIYTYSGRENECAPADTTIGIVDPSVKTIGMQAFEHCTKMKKCIIYDGVENIDVYAFERCLSLDALFLPSSIKKIDKYAFYRCNNIRILSIPTDIDISQIGIQIINYCDTFFRITHIQKYEYCGDFSTIESDDSGIINNHYVHQAILDFYRNAPPLHRACLDVNVSAQTIHDCIVTHRPQAASIIDHDGMTPLHILSLNPHATVGSIGECLDADMSAAFVSDGRGNTPLDYLMEHHLAAHTWIVTTLCVHREAYSSSAIASKNHNNRNNTSEKKRKRAH